ncbi:u3 small nucleolar RNA-associated protein [Anaeramoeba ignava]|uniref:U3 small nucleolar RNA-associated protein n=1 Tax=Anaeramoeba ignava TaxID=1746090 RepID=A0A9Q0LDU8_ANAIG|nr:u3 small nucleolar RNA-associated protein [Anaeramoeba ignava]
MILKKISQIYANSLQFHPENEDLWILSASFEFENNLNMNTSRKILQRALKTIPNSKKLWHEYFRMECIYVDQMNDENILNLDNNSLKPQKHSQQLKNFLNFAIPKIIFKNAIEKISNDIQFRADFIPISRTFSNSDSLIDEIYQSIQNDFPNLPKQFMLISERYFDEIILKKLQNENEFKKSFEFAKENYQKILEKNNSLEIWKYYILFHKKILSVTKITNNELINSILNNFQTWLYFNFKIKEANVFLLKNTKTKDEKEKEKEEYIRKIYQELIEKFGKNNWKIWQDFIEFEKKQNQFKSSSTIYWRAIKELPTHSQNQNNIETIKSFISTVQIKFKILKELIEILPEPKAVIEQKITKRKHRPTIKKSKIRIKFEDAKQNYENGILSKKNKDYQKAEELFKKSIELLANIQQIIEKNLNNNPKNKIHLNRMKELCINLEIKNRIKYSQLLRKNYLMNHLNYFKLQLNQQILHDKLKLKGYIELEMELFNKIKENIMKL